MLQSFFKQVNLLNCLLIVCIVFFAVFVLLPIFSVEVKVPLSVQPKVAEQKRAEAAETVHPPAQEYALIAEHNIFHPDRIIPAEKKAELVVPRPDFILYGTLIADNVSIAYINDKKTVRTTPGRGKRQIALKTGEALSGYTLKQVLPDRVVMIHGDDRIEVKMIDPSSKKERLAETTSPTQQTIPMIPTTRASAIPPGIPTKQPGTTVGGATPGSMQPTAGITSTPGNTNGLPSGLSRQPSGLPAGPTPGQPSGTTGPIYYQPGMRRAAPGQ